jgi:hypothetical protein
MKKSIIINILILILSGCSSDLLSIASKGSKDPEVSSPTVKSFVVERSLIVQWDKDDYCDEYILYKDTSPVGTFNTVAYRGNDTSFTDTKLTDDTFYYYRLAKRLGSKEFPKSAYMSGVSAFSRQDEYEYNDTKDTAKKIDPAVNSVTNGNIYYYNDGAGNVFEDVDWYYIRLEPSGMSKSTVRLIINKYSSNIDAGDIQYNIESQTPQPLYQGQPFDIVNGKNTAVNVYFMISVDKTKAVNPFVNKMGDYQLNIVYYQ